MTLNLLHPSWESVCHLASVQDVGCTPVAVQALTKKTRLERDVLKSINISVSAIFSQNWLNYILSFGSFTLHLMVFYNSWILQLAMICNEAYIALNKHFKHDKPPFHFRFFNLYCLLVWSSLKCQMIKCWKTICLCPSLTCARSWKVNDFCFFYEWVNKKINSSEITSTFYLTKLC